MSDTRSMTHLMWPADRSDDFERLGIDPARVEPWEDGVRENAAQAGTYEWWYFDSHLDDGTTLVVVFYTKPFAVINGGLSPVITISLTLADGRGWEKMQKFPAGRFVAATDTCDVSVAGNRFRGDLHRFSITATIDEISVEVDLSGVVPAWRHATGYLNFGTLDDGSYFAWLPSVPQGRVTARYSIGDEVHEATGDGYHDHNWGNASMPGLIHDWYWGRARVGRYTVIAAFITASAKYGYGERTSFLLATDDGVVVDDASRVTFSTEDVQTDERTGKPVAEIVRYEYEDGAERIVVTFRRGKTIASVNLADRLPRPRRLLAKLGRFDGAYLRFTGVVTVERFLDGTPVEEVSGSAVWELMYFGHARRPAR